jgi:hypothetical protein
MITLVAAYSVAAAAIGAYATWLEAGVRRLGHRLHELQSPLESTHNAPLEKRSLSA